MCMCVYVCVCIVMYGCLPASFQPPSSLLPASLQHHVPSSLITASFQPPSSLLPASSQPPSSLHHQSFLIHRCIDHLSVFVYMCIGNQSCVIYIHVHSPSIFFDNIYALVINLYGWFVTHTCTVFFWFCLPRTHVGALSADTKDVYPVCIALHMHSMPYDRLVFVELHIHN